MTSARDIIRAARSLPVEERAFIIETLMTTLNTPEPAMDEQWIALAKSRLSELSEGKVTPIPWAKVAERARARLDR